MNLRRLAGMMGSVAAGLAIVVAAASATVPHFLQYQGRATNSAGVALTSATVDVTIFNAPSAGTVLWSHSFGTLTFDNGRFSVVLDLSSGPNQTGLNNAFTAGSPMYIQAAIGGTPVGTPQLMSSVTYALRAQVADTASVSLSAAGSVAHAAQSDSTLHVLGAYVSSTVAKATLSDSTGHVLGANVSSTVAKATFSDSTGHVLGANVSSTVARATLADSSLGVRGGPGVGERDSTGVVTFSLNVTPGNAQTSFENHQDLAAVQITAPANGVIVVEGGCTVQLDVGNVGSTINVTAIGINAAASTRPVNLLTGLGSALSTTDLGKIPVTAAAASLSSNGTVWSALNCSGRFAAVKNTTYTFYLAGQGIYYRSADTNSGASSWGARTLRATFYPTTY